MSDINGAVRPKIDQTASRAQVPNKASIRKASGTAWTQRCFLLRGGAISAAGRETTAPGAPRTRSGSPAATAAGEAVISSNEKLLSPTSGAGCGAGCGGGACVTGAGDVTGGCSMLMVGADCGRGGRSRVMDGIDGGLGGARAAGGWGGASGASVTCAGRAPAGASR